MEYLYDSEVLEPFPFVWSFQALISYIHEVLLYVGAYLGMIEQTYLKGFLHSNVLYHIL